MGKVRNSFTVIKLRYTECVFCADAKNGARLQRQQQQTMAAGQRFAIPLAMRAAMRGFARGNECIAQLCLSV